MSTSVEQSLETKTHSDEILREYGSYYVVCFLCGHVATCVTIIDVDYHATRL